LAVFSLQFPPVHRQLQTIILYVHLTIVFLIKTTTMYIDADNKVVKLCAQGMDLEGQGKNDEASKVFLEAWQQASNNKEKFTAAHYVARHQKSVADKLTWDETALNLALNIADDSVKGAYPSLYLNIGKGYEDLDEFERAMENYETALIHANHLPEDGYVKMIKGGIENGIQRIRPHLKN
jgi:tetratricopeptide (TPR) repeat protein